MYTFECRSCHHSLSMPDSMFGKSEDCPYCSQRFLITKAPPEQTASNWTVCWLGDVETPEPITREATFEHYARWLSLAVLLVAVLTAIVWHNFSTLPQLKFPNAFYETAFAAAESLSDAEQREEAFRWLAVSLANHDHLQAAEAVVRRIHDADQRWFASIAISEAKYRVGKTAVAIRELQQAKSKTRHFSFRQVGNVMVMNDAENEPLLAVALAFARIGQKQDATQMLHSFYEPIERFAVGLALAETFVALGENWDAEQLLDQPDMDLSNLTPGMSHMFGTAVAISLPTPAEWAEMRLRLGKIRTALAQENKAKAAFEKALEDVRPLRPVTMKAAERAAHLDLLFRIATAQRNTDFLEESQQTLELAATFFAESEALIAESNFEEQYATMKRAELNRAYQIAFVSYWVKTGQTQEVAAKIEEFSSENDQQPWIEALADIGELDKAKQLFEQAKPNLTAESIFQITLHLAKRLRQNGQTTEAELLFTDAASLAPVDNFKPDDGRSNIAQLFLAYDERVTQKPPVIEKNNTTEAENKPEEPPNQSREEIDENSVKNEMIPEGKQPEISVPRKTQPQTSVGTTEEEPVPPRNVIRPVPRQGEGVVRPNRVAVPVRRIAAPAGVTDEGERPRPRAVAVKRATPPKRESILLRDIRRAWAAGVTSDD